VLAGAKMVGEMFELSWRTGQSCRSPCCCILQCLVPCLHKQFASTPALGQLIDVSSHLLILRRTAD
jgi:hypothetical protein